MTLIIASVAVVPACRRRAVAHALICASRVERERFILHKLVLEVAENCKF